ncbi:unnamed protein product [Tetraodon nigroviridis]|nr:unnamed protein product [Tetraodon nigroviridis]
MSNTPPQEPPGPELSFGSGQTLHSRPNQPVSDPSASKRVCFYKSGDYKFSGHRIVINGRTFKTYDALLDALSKKVPLPFGVRTITTPRGTHLVRTLDDLHDGGSYVCSDQKRVKPLNLEEVKRRQVPWNTTRPLTAGRRQRLQIGKRSEAANRPAKVTEKVAVRTPKKLVVISNRDPTFKRTIVLHRRSAPTFDALLDYLSQILQFPVLKLYSTDGRRIDGLAALILCSGVVVAAGNEPFKLGNYGFHKIGQITQAMLTDIGLGLQPKTRSRNFSLSSERFIVEQVNKSRNGSRSSQLCHEGAPVEALAEHPGKFLQPRGSDVAFNEQRSLIVPHEDDIEKSFRVNEDGSMTVEMKVHLTIKEAEVLHWTTTLSRSSLSKKTVYATGSANSSPDSNNAVAKHSFICEEETKEENCPVEPGRAVAFKKQTCEGYNSATKKVKSLSRRIPTPGPRQYVENWLEKVSPDREPYSEETFADDSEARAKVEFQIGGDSEENDKTEDDSRELCQSPGEEHVAGLCAGRRETRPQTHKPTQAILSASSASKEKIKPIMQQICSAVQFIKRASDTNTPPRPDSANSADKFSMQVASVFGSSCKLFLSFLSMMILQDYITGSQSRSASEATLMMESLQRVSTAEDEEEQRVSLEDLRNRASFQLKKSWKDFMDLSDRTETETELMLNVKAVDVFKDQCLIIDELMWEMNISQDLREVISSALRLASSFCPVEENATLETGRNQLDQAKESEMGDELGRREGTGEKMIRKENEEKIEEELKEEMAVKVRDELGSVEAGEMEVSEKEFKDEEAGEDEANKSLDELKDIEETEEEREAHTENVGESQKAEERLKEGTEGGDENDEMQSKGKDINSGGEETVAFTGKDVACNPNEQQVEDEVIREKTEETNGKNKNEEDKVAVEAGGEFAGNTKSVSTCEEEDEQSDRSMDQEGWYDDSNEEGNVPNKAAGDLDSEDKTTVDSNLEQENVPESPFKYSFEDQCEDDKGNGTDTVTEDGEEHCGERSDYLPHPLEISQELLDFVNSALQSSSLIFTYDPQGNVRLEPDNSQRVKNRQALIAKSRRDSQYGGKILPSPSTSELSDYRPETSESWGSKTQESTDIATESGEDASDESLVSKHKTKILSQEPNAEPANTGSSANVFHDSQEQSRGSFSSFSSETEPLKRVISKPATEVTPVSSLSLVGDSPDGVLIDQGRWLLKENHLIRKSPPLSSGMYGNADSTSTDSIEDTVTHAQTQLNPLTYISSSEIEELTKPKTPKCTYYNMSHGSDSDPFLDDCSLKSEKSATSIGKRRGVRVSPAIDTSKTWVSKNGSLSSFASVEFKMPDGKIHPEEESSAVAQTRRTSSDARRILQAQDSQDTRHMSCSQYCPIL